MTHGVMRAGTTLFLLLFAPLFSLYGQQQAPKTLKALDPGLMDTSADPCVNFYQYSCGGYLKQTPIPADESSYGQFNELSDQNLLVLKTILEKEAAGGSERTASEQKIGDFYAACMNVDVVDKAGLAPLQPLLDRVAALKSKDEFPEFAAYMDSIGVNTLFSFGSDQDFKDATQQIASLDQMELGLPEKGYYERKDEKSVKLRDQYKAHVARTGSDVSVIGYGRPLRDTLVIAERLAQEGIQVEVVDLRTVSPLDTDGILKSVAKTRRAVVVHEAPRSFGAGAEVAARIQEHLYGQLAAPVLRVASRDVTVPFAKVLETEYLYKPTEIESAIRRTLEAKAPR